MRAGFSGGIRGRHGTGLERPPSMSTPLFALIVLAGAAIYFMTPQERIRLLRAILSAVKKAVYEVTHPSASGEPFHELLRARTRWAVATPLLVLAHVIAFVMMAQAPGAVGELQTTIEWGANFAPRTTNGEWTRLFASTFVHGGFLHLLTIVGALLSVGLVLERAVGHLAFAATYVAAAVLASLVTLWTASPTNVSYGASGAVFGLYGLLLAAAVSAIVRRPPEPMPIPLATVKRIGAAAIVFALYNLFTDHLGTVAELVGLGTGLVGGLMIARGIAVEKPALRRAAIFAGATAAIAIAASVPMRGIIDFRPHIAHIAALEERTTGAYDVAVGQFKLGRMPSKRLAQLIDRTILPDLQSVRARLATLRGVPREQKPLVEAAETYFKLREQSWRRRAEGLLRSNLNMLREAERTERAALEAFQKILPPA
jgi:membrane associated rhomboid family serine protease